MEIISWFLLALLYVASLALISKIVENRRLPIQNLPPGPKPWPIIGNLNLIGSIPHQSLHYLSQKYGEIMLLKFGKFPVIVASSPNMAKLFLKVHDADFASRPLLAAGKYASYNYSDLTWAPYGPYWRQARKIYLSEVFNTKKFEFFEQIRVQEASNLLSRLRQLSGKPVVLRDELQRYTLSFISRMLSRDVCFTSEQDDLRGLIDEWFFLTGVFNIGDWIPWLSFLDLQGYVKRMKVLNKELDRVFDYVIDEHLAKRAKDKDFVAKDIVDVFLQISEDPNLHVELTRYHVKALLQNLMVGITDTSATTIEWALNEVLRHPLIMKKAKEEIDGVIGRNRWVQETDVSQLPYIESIIMETFRLHPLATFLAPHCAINDCNVAGYDIAKGTMVLINTWSIGRDPNSWDAPEEFLPERFMREKIDALGNNFSFLPFGSGRRRCPGYKLALKMIPTTFANLLHGFNFKLVEGMKLQDICMEEEYGLTTHPKVPLSIIMEPTLPPHLY
nr:BX4 [Lamium galeobdolon]